MVPAPGCRLGITLGDPRGIGPEVVAGALAALRAADSSLTFTLIGPTGTAADGAGDDFVATGTWRGGPAAAAGRLAGEAVETAVGLALSGAIDGLVTAPVDKSALHAAGYPFPGHTEMLAALTGGPDVAMLMAAERTSLGGPLRVVLATTHLPLRRVADAVTTDLLVRQVRLTADGLTRGWGIGRPRIALCAINPHASDGGLFGDEEARVYAPAIAALRDADVRVFGPVPADTVFVRTIRGEFDAVVAPYHDVGMAAFKTAAFGHGVNITLGLPFVRCSPDHGTALDIAGRGLADTSSMREAIELAARLAARRTTAARP